MIARRSVLLVACAWALVACSDDDGGAAGSTAVPVTAIASSAPPATSTIPRTVPASSAPATTSTTPVTTVAPADPLEVSTASGPVRGVDSDVPAVRAFLAIPYGAPPVGENRWRPPQPVASWEQPFDATSPGAACPQSAEGVTASVTAIPDWDEDCLTLSVWTPEDADELPVMVWFHGGGLTNGSAHQPLYVGDHLAGRGVVVVNVNYRLGALGFLATDELAAEEGGTFGNYGFADQVAALRWVADNAASFGGDPGNVTIFGESAGGFSVCTHLASPASAGLFHRAIVQSGGGCGRLQPARSAARNGARYVAAVGCDDVACLRARSARRLVRTPFSPSLVADGAVLTTSALDQAAAGDAPAVPVLIGSNADEATLFTIGAPEPTETVLLTRAAAMSRDPAAVLDLYPPDQFPTGLARLQAMLTDTGFVCPTLAFASAAPGTFVYHYTYVSASNPFGLGATHGAELVLLFGHPEGIRGLTGEFDASTAAVSEEIQRAWVAFASTGDPGWPDYGRRGRVMLLDDPSELVTEIRDGRCEALDRLS
jgi:para-nitrobenzyl esterase